MQTSAASGVAVTQTLNWPNSASTSAGIPNLCGSSTLTIVNVNYSWLFVNQQTIKVLSNDYLDEGTYSGIII